MPMRTGIVPRWKSRNHVAKQYKDGDLFSVELSDGSFALGQVISVGPFALGSVAIGPFNSRAEEPWTQSTLKAAPMRSPVAAQLALPKPLNKRVWPIVGSDQLPQNWQRTIGLDDLIEADYVGARVLDR
ncbi:hypothetical protein C3941_07680 [Kaistia algarum]|uniref:Imm26 family immunity protein n=1 Tax=Kaistia algarum TaxID=2083279 RepID=UPI000CE7F0F8|nr:hypothetical protein C3941_07680 [Kaistia algarum]